MENLQTILDRVLAGVGEMVAQRKGDPIRGAAVIAPIGRDGGAGKVAGDASGRVLKSAASAFTTDDTLPAQRGHDPKSTAGGKR